MHQCIAAEGPEATHSAQIVPVDHIRVADLIVISMIAAVGAQ